MWPTVWERKRWWRPQGRQAAFGLTAWVWSRKKGATRLTAKLHGVTPKAADSVEWVIFKTVLNTFVPLEIVKVLPQNEREELTGGWGLSGKESAILNCFKFNVLHAWIKLDEDTSFFSISDPCCLNSFIRKFQDFYSFLNEFLIHIPIWLWQCHYLFSFLFYQTELLPSSMCEDLSNDTAITEDTNNHFRRSMLYSKLC